MRRPFTALAVVALLAAAAAVGISYAQSGATSVAKTVGQTATLAWTAPTTDTSGNPLTGTLSYNVYAVTSGAATPVVLGAQLLSGLSAATYTTAAFTATGSYCYAVTAVQTANGVESVESAPSNPVCATVTPAVPATPNPPGATIS